LTSVATMDSRPTEVTPSGRVMREAVLDLMERLPGDVAGSLRFDFDDAARVDWAYYPKEAVGAAFHGVALADVDPTLQRRIHRVVETGLSGHAYGRASVIRAFETVLDAREGHRDALVRDSLRYYLAVFGEPAETGTWGWRFEGHHLSINHTIVDDEVVASTPIFFGSNPAEIRRGTTPVVRPCGEEEDAARELIGALDAERRSTAIISEEAPIDILVADSSFVPPTVRPGDPPHPIEQFQRELEAMPAATREHLTIDRGAPRGIRYDQLHAAEQSAFDQLIDVYLTRIPDDLAAVELGRIDAAGREHLHFAWAGTTRRRGPHYYRIQGPDLLVEYDCVQNDADHIHAVWRRPDSDFGGDALRSHLRVTHGLR
jgi:hypothetical protein